MLGLVLTLLIQLAAYAIAETYSIKTEEESKEVLANIQQICPDFNKPIGNERSFRDIGLAVVFWGALLGVIVQREKLGGQPPMTYPTGTFIV